MATIWHVRGAKAGTFEDVTDEEAAKAAAEGDAQIADGLTPLAYPEGHPGYESPKKPSAPPSEPKSNRGKKKYPNKMMQTDDE